MSDSLKTMPARLKHARKDMRGLSQVQIAEKLGISQQSYAEWETGAIRNPRGLAEAAAILRISYAWLKNGEGQPEEDTPFLRIMKTVNDPEMQQKVIAAYELFRGQKVE